MRLGHKYEGVKQDEQENDEKSTTENNIEKNENTPNYVEPNVLFKFSMGLLEIYNVIDNVGVAKYKRYFNLLVKLNNSLQSSELLVDCVPDLMCVEDVNELHQFIQIFLIHMKQVSSIKVIIEFIQQSVSKLSNSQVMCVPVSTKFKIDLLLVQYEL
eukprot:UN23503